MTTPTNDRQARLNHEVWASADLVEFYSSLGLRPVEELLLERHREPCGRVLELGCGSGRVTEYLAEVVESLYAVDVSPAMVAHCRATYPGVEFAEGDIGDLAWAEPESFAAVVAPFNVIDVLGGDERVAAIRDIGRILATGGMFVMSSHNRGFAPPAWARARSLWIGDRRRPFSSLARLPTRLRNHLRLRRLEHVEQDVAILNDEAHEFSLLHYYITRDAEERQLRECGFVLREALDLDGRVVAAGDLAATCPELHYVARKLAASGG